MSGRDVEQDEDTMRKAKDIMYTLKRDFGCVPQEQEVGDCDFFFFAMDLSQINLKFVGSINWAGKFDGDRWCRKQ